MIDTTLESTLNAARLNDDPENDCPELSTTGQLGMAWLFEDRPTGKCLGLFTYSFAERFCSDNPGYVWRAA